MNNIDPTDDAPPVTRPAGYEPQSSTGGDVPSVPTPTTRGGPVIALLRAFTCDADGITTRPTPDGLTHVHLHVLTWFAWHANASFIAWPSQRRMQVETLLSERALRDIIDELVEADWLTIVAAQDAVGRPRIRYGSGRDVIAYRVNMTGGAIRRRQRVAPNHDDAPVEQAPDAAFPTMGRDTPVQPGRHAGPTRATRRSNPGDTPVQQAPNAPRSDQGSDNDPSMDPTKEPTGEHRPFVAPFVATIVPDLPTDTHTDVPSPGLALPGATIPLLDVGEPAGSKVNAEIERVWSVYLECRLGAGMRKNPPALTPKRRELIRKALVLHGLERIELSVRGLWLDPGRVDDGYIDIEYAFREKNIDRFGTIATNHLASLASKALIIQQPSPKGRAVRAYGHGQRTASGQPYPDEQQAAFDLKCLHTILTTYATGDTEEARLSSLAEISEAYRRVRGSAPEREDGFAPSACLRWLKGGRPAPQQPNATTFKNPHADSGQKFNDDQLKQLATPKDKSKKDEEDD